MGEQYENDLNAVARPRPRHAYPADSLHRADKPFSDPQNPRYLRTVWAPATGSARKPHIPKTLKNRQTRKFSSALPRQQ